VKRHTLAEIAYRLGRKARREVAMVAQPETILAWYRRLIANQFDGSKSRRSPEAPRVGADIESLVVCLAKENPSWGYDRIVGALANLGHQVSDQTVGNILRRHGTAPAPQRKNTVGWKDFIRTHLEVMAATDFFTAEVLTGKGPVTYYVRFFIHWESRRICVSGMTRHPDQEWMEQQARAVSLQEWGFLAKHKYRLQDRDAKFCPSFRQLIETDGRKTIVLPARSPNLNAYAERWVRSVKEECLSRFILFGERALRRALQQYGAHDHEERNHQGRQDLLLFPRPSAGACKAEGTIRCRERLGGLLKYYDRQAA
jgi:putative transposase